MEQNNSADKIVDKNQSIFNFDFLSDTNPPFKSNLSDSDGDKDETYFDVLGIVE
jgi:hypothetical protein